MSEAFFDRPFFFLSSDEDEVVVEEVDDRMLRRHKVVGDGRQRVVRLRVQELVGDLGLVKEEDDGIDILSLKSQMPHGPINFEE